MLDVSTNKKIKDCKHWSAKINQLYHPTGCFSQDVFNIVYSYGNINTTKFSPILLKEWFFLLKKDGYLVIDYLPDKKYNWGKLEAEMWWLWKGKYEIVFHGQIDEAKTVSQSKSSIEKFIEEKKSENRQGKDVFIQNQTKTNSYYRFVCCKQKSTIHKTDSIDKWTFGIITNGKRKEWLEKIIRSIRDQDIPEYEIIVCGNYFDRKEKDFKYLPFFQRDNLGWITKKKNLIVKAAKYENLCIIHDRIYFSNNWFKGMKKWGNCFEHLACMQYFGKTRLNDWQLHEKINQKEFTFTSFMDYRDWDKNVIQSGQLHIFKKRIAAQELWNESYFWKMPEDIRISEDLNNRGYLLRINPDAKMEAFMEKFSNLPEVVYNPQKTPLSREGNRWKIFARRLYLILFQIPYFNLVLRKMEKHIFK